MKTSLVHLVLTIFPLFSWLNAQTAPKHEFRGAWLATVANLDWPTTPNLSATIQKAQLISYFNELQKSGINAVIFQIRSECDAMYQSPFEPWSYWLTGKQGKAPVEFYDPLQFAIKEAHKRGMELHAWFNPFRAERSVGNYQTASNHVTRQHPGWIISKGSLKLLNPGIPAVREYVVSIIMDVVRRYDIDGVHFDDYFYPYSPNNITNADDQLAFNVDPRGFTNRGDWRRDNINRFVDVVHDSIATVKPWVIFGISPFGIWRDGTPTGTTGTDAYSVLYADALAWLANGSLDYLAPQLYWPYGGGQDYAKLQSWWALNAAISGAQLYPGLAVYKAPDWPDAEIKKQILDNRENQQVDGQILFRSQNVVENAGDVRIDLQADLYEFPALTPSMPWKDQHVPSTPGQFTYQQIDTLNRYGFVWQPPIFAPGQGVPNFYILYRFDTPPANGAASQSEHIVAILDSTRHVEIVDQQGVSPFHYAITTLSRNSIESQMSPVISVAAPSVPVATYPPNDAQHGSSEITFHWEDPGFVSAYQLHVARDANFTEKITTQTQLADTSFYLTGLNGQTTYFWKILASNAGGTSSNGRIHSFFTAFPKTPELASPRNAAQDQPTEIVLEWRSGKGATAYHLQIATYFQFEATDLIFESDSITDTTFAFAGLAQDNLYYWRVRAINNHGASMWPRAFFFRTHSPTGIADIGSQIPGRFRLAQNYPNPFNPVTTIPFVLKAPHYVRLVVYDLRGRKIKTLIDQSLRAGKYEVKFNGSGLPAGIYIYRLSVNGKLLSRRMMLVK